MDPTTATRRQFTENLVSQEAPADADASYTKLFNSLKALLRALAYHEAMSPNIDQTFMTPAAYKNKVYFMWDYVGRTLGMLTAGINVKNPDDGPNGGAWGEVMGRAAFASVLIKDTSGKLDMMCPDQRGQNVQFGQEIVGLADELSK